jgi:predicted glycosyltransferase involved in capsule biosynthesis
VLYSEDLQLRNHDVFVFNDYLAYQKSGKSIILDKDVNYNEHLSQNESKKLQLEDVTFIIPVKYDSEDRVKNLQIVLSYLNRFVTTNIIIVESMGTKMGNAISDLIEPMNITYLNISYDGNKYWKTRSINEAFKLCKTPIFCVHDSDILLPIKQIEKTVELLRKNQAELLLPYDDYLREIGKDDKGFVLKSLTKELDQFGEFDLPNSGDKPPGGCFFTTSKVFKFIGRANENFIGWGPEDQEIIERTKILQGRTGRVDGEIYHLYHSRTVENTQFHDGFKANYVEFAKVASMNHNQLCKYMKTWSWV